MGKEGCRVCMEMGEEEKERKARETRDSHSGARMLYNIRVVSVGDALWRA